MSNLKSSDDNNKKNKHVVIKTDDIQVASTSSSKPALEVKNAASQTRVRPSSLHLLKSEAKVKTRNRSKSIDYNTQKRLKTEKTTNFDKLHKLKEKLLHSSPDLNDSVSDDEGTPLVSEISSPSPSDFAKTSSSASSSFPLSPLSQRSLTLDAKKFQVRSEQNLTEMTELSPMTSVYDPLLYPVSSKDSGPKKLDVSPTTLRPRSNTFCESVSNYSLSPVLSNSTFSLHSKNSQSFTHLSRQDAVESEEVLTDVYCDPDDRM